MRSKITIEPALPFNKSLQFVEVGSTIKALVAQTQLKPPMVDTSYFNTYDSGSFSQFCGPAQVHKALNTLYGPIVGIQADGHINERETDLLR